MSDQLLKNLQDTVKEFAATTAAIRKEDGRDK